MKGTFRRVGMTIIPVGRTGSEAVLAVPDSKLCMGDIFTARNPKHHNLFWTLCELVADAEDSDKETVKRWVIRKLNYGDYSVLVQPNGNALVEFVPDSIAWESMAQAEFNEFFQQAVEILAIRLGTTKPELLDRFNDLVKGSMP